MECAGAVLYGEGTQKDVVGLCVAISIFYRLRIVFDATKKFLRKRPELTDGVFDTVTYFDVNNMASLLQVKRN